MVIEWKGILFVLFTLVLALLGIKIIEKKIKIHAELKRKLFHVIMGLVMLTFPYIFKSVHSVFLLGFISIVILVIIKNTKLKNSLGTVLYGVQRESLGEIFFAISVMLIFYLSKGDKILYSIPILVLTFADSTAALIGRNYGKKDLAEQNEDSKSIEGSFMFFMVAFMATLVPLLLFTTVGREETLIISTIVGFNVALIEMISHTGNDNLLIPLTTYALIAIHVGLGVEELRTNLLILGIIFVLVTIANRIKAWSKLALVETLVIGYLTVTLYGIYALIPPAMLLFTSMKFPSRRENEKDTIYDARIIETNVLVGIAIAGIVAITGLKREMFITYALAYSMHLAINTFVRFKYFLNLSEADSLIFAFTKAVAFVFIPSLIVQRIVFGKVSSLPMVIFAFALLLLSCVKILKEKRNVEKEETSIKNGLMHMRIVVELISIMIIVQLLIA